MTAIRTAWRWTLASLGGALVVFAMQPGNGTLLLLAVPLFLFGFVFRLLRRTRDTGKRRHRNRSLGWLLLGLVLMVGAQSYWHWRLQQRAAQAIAMLVTYQQRNGVFPANLEAAGLPSEAQAGLRYRLHQAGPDLRYSATVMPLTEYVYDFAQQRWQRNAH